ncbi:GNAT family N-acetyltransferase [Aneurinibacillus aneurinilyticus]|uniref:GNAT family N-acetyltransferase n=1 Tax=Aneurinibacillus aneurinilyticus TaxID=1391 RepID=UPI0023F1131D|nr:GNAT family N-acetyltransferase [Aneurinibacillus aneurinilyticus]MED0673986.1 GNAT family N-acetyltransferase [Aneurinibacillus aneurinilyticus]
MINQKAILIKELKNEKEWKEAYPVMKQLRTHLDEDQFLQLIQEAAQKEDDKMAALYEKGYGEALLNYVHNWSKENGYDIVSLSSGLQRIDAHRFYENKMEYDKVSYVFLKRL